MELAATLLTIALNVSIALTVFAYALRAGSEDVRFLLRERRLLALSLLSIFVLTPFIAIAIVEWIEMPYVARVALVALSVSIIAPALPSKSSEAGGHRSYAIGLTMTAAVVAIVAVPVLVDLLGRVTERPYGVPTAEIAGYVLTILGAPLVAGVLFRSVAPGFARRIYRPLIRVGVVISTVALVGELVPMLPKVWSLVGTGTILGMVLFTVAALATGHLMGGPDRERELVLALFSATRHPAIAFTITTANFPGERFSAAIILCLIVNAIVCFPYVGWHRRRHRSLLAATRGDHAS